MNKNDNSPGFLKRFQSANRARRDAGLSMFIYFAGRIWGHSKADAEVIALHYKEPDVYVGAFGVYLLFPFLWAFRGCWYLFNRFVLRPISWCIDKVLYGVED